MRKALLVLLLIGAAGILKGSALNSPPILPRQWVITATGTAQTVSLRQSDPTLPVVGPTKSLILCNDGAAGTPDIWVGFNGTTAISPPNGGQVLTIRATERASYDIQTGQISVMSSGASNTLRVQATY